ncbi:puromycin-sensitive aminopeptidase-like isoform X2 [Primulina tabacum]|uniref:puromycin-sensitive aminopeptidase-like isoform X2 n=1 Tax=Primulina tabacum TaxID=48773 RepID=UPI003F5A9B00
MENKSLNILIPNLSWHLQKLQQMRIMLQSWVRLGTRVTCRDWFQLGLKEGLTVFRDQEFPSDLGSRPVKRIADVSKMQVPWRILCDLILT